MSSHEVKPNAFSIPEKSSITNDKRMFPKVVHKRPSKTNPISLPGSSVYLPLKWMEKSK